MARSDELLPLVYDRLRKFAYTRLKDSNTLCGTGLVHEGYLRLAKIDHWESESHFYNALRNAMRSVIVDHLRNKSATKRGGNLRRISMECMDDEPAKDLEGVLALVDALDELSNTDKRAADVVTLRFFACMSMEEVAESIGVSKRTVVRDWTYAKAWLQNALRESNFKCVENLEQKAAVPK